MTAWGGGRRFGKKWVFPPGVWDLLRSTVASEEVSSVPLATERAAPSIFELRTSQASRVFWIPLTRLRYQTGVAYTVEQHHGVRLLARGIEDFQSFYRRHLPTTALQANFLFDSDDPTLNPPVFSGKPWGTPWPADKWPEGHPAWGPAEESLIRSEEARYRRILASILRHGFDWKRSDSDPIRFQVLIDDMAGEDYVVTPVSGKHRVAVLAHLGWHSIPMRPAGTPDREVRLSELSDWPGVVDGRFSQDQAMKYFKSFFRDPRIALLSDW